MRAQRSFLLSFPALLIAASGCLTSTDSSELPSGEQPGVGLDAVEMTAWSPTGLRSPKETTKLLPFSVLEAPIGKVTPVELTQEVPSNDTCAGATAVTLDLNGTDHFMIQSSTTDAIDDYQGFCSGAGGPDVVYAITLAQAGVLDVSVSGSGGMIPTATLRDGDCLVDAGWDYCIDTTNFGGRLPSQAFDAGTYYLFIDSEDGAAGGYNLNVLLSPTICGDGIVSGAEACDDNFGIAGDGCFDCAFEVPEANMDECPGESVDLIAGIPVVKTGFNTGYADNYTGSCAWEGGLDHVFHIMPSASGTLTATVGNPSDCDNASNPACWDRVIYIREGSCDSDAAELDCSDSMNWKAVETVETHVTGGVDYFVIVDGYDGAWYSYGNFTLSLELTADE